VSNDRLLGRAAIESLLAELGSRCLARGARAEMFIVGGSAMALAYSDRRVTRDIDAVFEPKAVIYEQAQLMAEEQGLPPDWLNDAVKGLLPAYASQEDDVRVLAEYPGLTVSVPSPDYLFAMKAASAREGADAEDLLVLAQLLGIRTLEQAFAGIVRFYDRERLPAKVQFFVEQTILDSTPDVDIGTLRPQRERGGPGSNQHQRKPPRR
jgi:hypothetical protein